jgi:integrase
MAESILGFETLARKWLAKKQDSVTTKTWKVYTDYMERAIAVWGDRNVKGVRHADIQDFLDSLDLGAKSKANVKACLHSFWTWMKKQEYITSEHFPTFPEVKFKLGRRKTVTKEVQGQILDEIYRQTYRINPKIWLGVKWLATYVCLRPGDLPRIRECDIDLRKRVIFIRDPKATEPYELPLTDDDVSILRDLPRGVGELPFFRHAPSVSWSQGRPFGEKYWYKWWKKACEALGIEGVDLYGGTRHSSVRAMRHTLSPEQIKCATMHRTNEAFERYYSVDSEDLREMYESAQNVLRDGVYRPEMYKPPRCTARVPPKSRVQKRQVVELKRK